MLSWLFYGCHLFVLQYPSSLEKNDLEVQFLWKLRSYLVLLLLSGHKITLFTSLNQYSIPFLKTVSLVPSICLHARIGRLSSFLKCWQSLLCVQSASPQEHLGLISQCLVSI